jgi:hypothetical protein
MITGHAWQRLEQRAQGLGPALRCAVEHGEYEVMHESWRGRLVCKATIGPHVVRFVLAREQGGAVIVTVLPQGEGDE